MLIAKAGNKIAYHLADARFEASITILARLIHLPSAKTSPL
jgi:hypothetical protein